MIKDSVCWDKKAYEGMCTWEYDGFQYEVYQESFALKCMYNVLKQTAGRRPDAAAVVDCRGHKCTYRKLLEKTDRFAEYLQDVKGVKHGDHIGMMTLTKDQVTAFLRPVLAKYKIPRIIEFMDEIPKTENNKINKKYLREYFNQKYQ